jgi:uncharacterized repeat protein (TIGR03803 family)
MRVATESGTIRTPGSAGKPLNLGALDSMTSNSPQPAMLSFWTRCAIAAIGLAAASVQAQTPAVSTILAMSGSTNPDGVVLGPDGALYGAAATSSSSAAALFYRVTVDGLSVGTLYQFRPADGFSPAGALVLGKPENLFYGTTQFSNGGVSVGGGTIFRIAPDGSGFAILHEFAPSTSNNVNSNPINPEGNAPHGALIEGSSDGFLYGATRFGGLAGAGTIFKVRKDGSEFEVLHSFETITSAAGQTIVNFDGAHPRAGLVESDGYFYGTTNTGGPNGQGTIFRLRFDGSEFSVLHVFSAVTGSPATNEDGALPQAGLTVDDTGILYGTTTAGGANGLGVVYSISSISPDGAVLTPMHYFSAEDGDGSQPIGTLLLGIDGRLYGTANAGGTTSSGAASTLGTVYSIARDARPENPEALEKLYNFETATGANPSGRLVQLNATEFFGTTTNGGRCGNGTVFRLSLAGTTVEGDTTCGQTSGGGGGGAMSRLSLLMLAILLLLGASHRRAVSRRLLATSGRSNTSDAHRLSQSTPRSRLPRTM